MKKLILALTLTLSSQAYALGDIDRGILFYANSLSMGTFIAHMEGEIAKIKLDYAKQAAQAKLDMEKDRQAYLKSYLLEQKIFFETQKELLTKELNTLRRRSKQYDLVVSLSKRLFSGVLKREALVAEIKKLEKSSPGVRADWQELLEGLDLADSADRLTSAALEQILLSALDVQAGSEVLADEIQRQIKLLDGDIQNLQENIEALK